MAALPLSLTLPAATAAAAYLDARYHIREDLANILRILTITFAGQFRERKDRLNGFYKLEEWATSPKHADRTFLIFEGRKWTYKEAYQNTIKYGTWVKDKWNVKSGEIVALDAPNCDVFVWMWFGLWAIGAKPAFINFNLTDKPLVHSVDTSTARLVLVHDGLRDKYSSEVVQELGREICFLTPEVRAEIDATTPRREPDECRGGQQLIDMSMLIYTSGTTGLPKPAVVSWTKAVVAPLFVCSWLPLKQDSVLYTCMPLYHSAASLMALLAALYAGCTCSLGAEFHRKTFWDDCRSTGATHIQYVGETLRYLTSTPPGPRDKDHNVVTAYGNGLRPDVWRKFKDRFGIQQINEFYSATEGAGLLSSIDRSGFNEGAVGTSGALMQTLFGARSIVLKLDEDMEDPIRDPKTGLCVRVKPGEPGELAFKLDEKKIDDSFQGYFGNKKASEKKILRNVLVKGDAYFSTGDVLRRDSEGRWFFCDRIGDTYRWKSENVSTAEVAEVLGRVEEISEANVYGVEVPGHDGRAGCAALVLNDDTEQIDEALLRQMAATALKSLPRYAVPVFLRILSRQTAERNRTGTNKQQKHKFRSHGVDPSVVERQGDMVYWLAPGQNEYSRFGEVEWRRLKTGLARL